ncbi:glycosyltransferase family 4 protein [Candidatus Uhrbacteria bacterium]|nr:glycosyltransferase family 4 protein [Candidatus Uhrbacteria bacterium]
MIKRILLRLTGIIGNLTSGWRGFTLAYIVETYDWSIKHDGESITHALNQQGLIRARITYCPCLIENQIVHFGSINTFFTKTGWNRPHPSNRIVLTWFHVEEGDPRLERLAQVQQEVDVIHTSCESTKQTLVAAGIDEHKVVVIPLGVDTTLFTPVIQEQKREIRKRLGIDPDRLVIGSFQKDGVGWGEGLEPKLIKGPDVLVETIARLKDRRPLILLTGPARGYVKHRLDELEIDYIHTYLQDTTQLPMMYHTLDLYLITSRLEGGPKSLLEAWASGVPVVSTRVGMVSDIAVNMETVLLAATDSLGLSQVVQHLLKDAGLRNRLVSHALAGIPSFDWKKIARRYSESLYV